MQDENAYKFLFDSTDYDSAIMSCLQSADEIILRFIKFFQQIQCQYIELLWNYISHQQENEQHVYKYFLRLLQIIFQLQATGRIFRDFIYSHSSTRNRFKLNISGYRAPTMSACSQACRSCSRYDKEIITLSKYPS